jgi:arylsulfatase A-like enzyme
VLFDLVAAAYPDLDASERAYATMIAAVDDALGQLVHRCTELGVLGNTVIVFTSDNGGLSAHSRGAAPDGRTKHAHTAPLRSGKGSAYEGGIRVPFVAAGPGIAPRAAADATPVIGTDLYPTLIALAGASVPAGRATDGVDLSPVLRGAARVPERAFLFHQPHAWGPEGPGIEPFSAIRVGDWKLIWFHDDLGPGERIQLFDVVRDPGEADDRSSSQPAKRAELIERLGQALQDAGAQMPVDRARGSAVACPRANQR